MGLSSAEAFWEASHEQTRTNPVRATDDAVEEAFWEQNATGYDSRSPLAACATDLVADLQRLQQPCSNLLEIGAGPGAFTRRLAKGLAKVTVVEPSAAMRAEFQRLWDGPDIVNLLDCKWEDAPDTRADFVFGANAFYRMRDIRAALCKMNASARHRVALVQTVGKPHAKPLSVTFIGKTLVRERADVLCDVLQEIGVSYRRRDYDVPRPDGPSRAALIDWAPVQDLAVR